jgi:squalene monooxygenase
MNENYFDIIVIGAGVAGGVFACSQENENCSILVIERDFSEKDRIVGELMQPGGIAALKQLNLESLLDGLNAQEVEGYTLIKQGEFFTIPYPENEVQGKGLGMQNGKFLLNIQNHLAKQKNVTLVEGSALSLLEDEQGNVIGVEYCEIESKKTRQAKAPLTIVCDGPLSTFRDRISNVKKIVNSYFIGMVLKNIEPISDKTGHIIVSGKSPVLVYPINKTEWRILIDFPGDKAPRMGVKINEYLTNEIFPIIPAGMRKSFLEALEEGDIKVMPNHNMKARAFQKAGVSLLGDSLNMRHPLTGGGMTACFLDVISLNNELKKINRKKSNEVYQAVVKYYENRRKNVESINLLANALYQVVKDDELKDAVFTYLKKGGKHAEQPLSLLAGLNKDKQLLLVHFFKVAIQNPSDFILRPVKQFRKINKAVNIMLPLLKEENKPAISK